jgi:hypothetical protein
VVLRISDLKEIAPDFSPNAFVVLQADSNQEIPYQVDDIDNDGEEDEIAMIMDMEPGERKRVIMRYAPGGRPVTLGYEKRTRAAIHSEYEGIGWESELIAYRIYPDHRNSINVFGKREPGLSLDKFAASVTGEGYNHLEPWGVNVMDAGKSVGCGGFGIWYGDRFVKPLNMPGKHFPEPDGRIARYTRIAADGPIRSAIQVIFDNWRVGEHTLKVTATYSIFAGQRWTRNDVKIEGSDDPVKIAIGLMKSKNAALTRSDKDGFFHTWGTQSRLDPPDELGMAVIYPTESFDSFREGAEHSANLPDDEPSGSHFAVLNPGADNEIAYWFLAAWSRGEIGMKKDSQFAELVPSVARRLRHPLTVTLMPSKSPPEESAD